MSQEVFFLHNLDFYYYLYLLPKSKIDYDSPTILFLQAFVLPSELLLEANCCEVLKKMKSIERLCLNKKKYQSRVWRDWVVRMTIGWIACSLHFTFVVNFLMQGFHPYHLWPNLCHVLMDLATMLYTRIHKRKVQGP